MQKLSEESGRDSRSCSVQDITKLGNVNADTLMCQIRPNDVLQLPGNECAAGKSYQGVTCDKSSSVGMWLRRKSRATGKRKASARHHLGIYQ